jgi:CubicO group peptidase (beta-lactamase class C family)
MKLLSFIRKVILSLFLCLFLVAPLNAQTKPPAGLNNYIRQVQKQFEVPGVAIAIVKDGEVVLTKGYGIKKLGESDPVNDRTLFAIASNTKAFTATALALLVEEGKLEWDAPVIRYLPWFQLSDPYVTREITIRDLLVHRSGLGLGAGDLLWWPPSNYNRKEIVQRLQFLPLATSFRSSYAYDNVLYLVAGEVIETISGMSWEEFVSRRILNEIGMTDSNVRHSEAGRGTEAAQPHARIEGTVRVVSSFASDNTNPAGGINASARDMGKWLVVQLDSGRVSKEERLFSPETTKELWTIVTPRKIADPPPELPGLRKQFSGYALGFGVNDYCGHKLVYHTGDLPGFVSRVAMIPAIKLGVAVLTNQESTEAYDAISYFILDYYLNAPKTDWLKGYTSLVKRIESEKTIYEQKLMTSRNQNSQPSLPLLSYCGKYIDSWYGEMTIVLDQGKLLMRFLATPSLVGQLEHYQYDTFICRWQDRELRADAFVTFILDPFGAIDQIKMQPVTPATDFSFDFQDLLFKPAVQ